MDTFYDRHGAVDALEALAAVRRESLSKRLDSSVIHMADISVDKLKIAETGQQRKSWRLCIGNEDDGVSDEIVVRIQGILTKNNLVPKNAQTCGRGKAMFLSQQAEICGMGTTIFNESMLKIAAVTDYFDQHLSGAELGSIAEVDSSDGRLFSACNRFFTSKSDAPSEQDTEFQNGVDPLNVLRKLKANDLIHAPDNIVNKVFYDESVPGAFRPGDIVELQVSFVALKTAGNKVKVTTRLQAVTLLTNEFTKKAASARAMAQVRVASRSAVRRKVGYFQEDDDEERVLKKRRMDARDEAEMEDQV
ncbi:hypothetical protein DFH09DRAFT_1330302 [Mycena vulgaris]|nr:hypothetical protein DFH09DRAFT_1330302 [Mycena vulgaris]